MSGDRLGRWNWALLGADSIRAGAGCAEAGQAERQAESMSTEMPIKPTLVLPTEILGECHGVRIFEGCGPGPCITILCEDDGFWRDSDCTFDQLWIQDLVQVLERASNLIERAGKQDARKAH